MKQYLCNKSSIINIQLSKLQDWSESLCCKLYLSGLNIDSDESTIIMGAEVGGEVDDTGGGGGGETEELLLPLESLMEKAKFYTSLCLGTTAILSVFAFLFLIPFVVDPAISTILADYESTAVTCMAVEHVYAEGLSNCSWSSCKEGCTSAALKCHQIMVNYSRLPFEEFTKVR